MEVKVKEKVLQMLLSWLLLSAVLLLGVSCGGDEPVAKFTADFSYEFIDDNNVRFTNKSDGEYFLLDWDFGNGETASNSLKNNTYEIYYPKAGTYTIRLTIIDSKGDRETVKKKYYHRKDDLVVAFSATPDSQNPNRILLKNTSVGVYSSFKWLIRGRTIENKTEAVAYFPYSGSHIIELQVTKGTVVYSSKQTINIAADDAGYEAGFTLSWADEFSGSSVNTTDWTFETGATGWGNNELQNYTSGGNAELKDGKLIITARKVNNSQTLGSYTSTRMITKGKKEFTYGRMEIRAKLPSGRGIWPALWMLGANISSVSWPACGEIDILEYVGYQPNTIHSTVHTPSGYGAGGKGASKTLETAEENFHVYGLIWTEKKMVFYIDSPTNVTFTYSPSIKTAENWPFDKALFFIFNIAVGGNWGGAQGIDDSIFPQTLEIDYVRVYQPTE